MLVAKEQEIGPENPPDPTTRKITAEMLGSDDFKRDYGIKYAYVAGAM